MYQALPTFPYCKRRKAGGGTKLQVVAELLQLPAVYTSCVGLIYDSTGSKDMTAQPCVCAWNVSRTRTYIVIRLVQALITGGLVYARTRNLFQSEIHI